MLLTMMVAYKTDTKRYAVQNLAQAMVSNLRCNRPLKNVFEAADAGKEQVKKRSLCGINERFDPVFNTVTAMQIVFNDLVRTYFLSIYLLSLQHGHLQIK